MNIKNIIVGGAVRLGLFIAITEVFKNPKNIKRIKYFIIGANVLFILISLLLAITHFDKDLYKKEMDEIRKDYNESI